MNAQIAYDSEGYVIPTWTFADKLRKCRGITGMDQRTFAQHIGVKPSAYAQWEADNNKPRDIVTVAKSIEMLTRVPATWLLGIGATQKAPTPKGEGLSLPGLDSNQEPAGSKPEPSSEPQPNVIHANFGRPQRADVQPAPLARIRATR